jgi:hypothetical protein
MDTNFRLVLAADKASCPESCSLWTVLIVVESRVFRRVRLILPRRDKMHAHVETYVLGVAAVQSAGSWFRKSASLVAMMRRLLLQSEVVLSWASIGLLEADDLLSSGCIETFVEHLALVGQLMTVLRIGVVR